MGRTGELHKSHPEAARPTDRSARPGQGRACGEGQGRAGAELGRVLQAGPARPPPPHSQSKPSTGARGAAGNRHPRATGMDQPRPARLPEGRLRPPRPHPASALTAPSPHPPRHTCPRGRHCPTWPRAWQGPAPSVPIGGPAPQLTSHWASPHRGGARPCPPGPR